MPGDPTLTNPFNEIRSIESFMFRNRSVQAQVGQFTPKSAALYANYAKDYPWMTPGVIRAASLAGYYPNNPDMVRVAKTQLAEGIETGRVSRGTRQRAGFANPGRQDPDVQFAASLPQNKPSLEDDPYAYYIATGMIDKDGNLHRPAEPQYNKKGWETGEDLYKYTTPGAEELDRNFQELLRLVAKDQGSNKPIPYHRGGQWYLWHPKTGNSEVVQQEDRSLLNTSGIISQAQIGPNLTEQMGGVPVLGEVTRGVQSVVEPAYQAIQPATRVAGMAANYGIQEFQQAGRNIHTAVKQVQEEGFGSLANWNPPPPEMKFGGEATDIGIAAEHLLAGEDVDTGSGFFVSPTSQVARERVAREAEAGQIGGHNITWGRWIADSITTPDTIPFDLMSGFVDFAIAVGDPTAAGLGTAGKARRASLLFEAENVVDPYVKAGVLGSIGRRPAVNINTAEKYFDSPIGVKAIEDITNTTSAYQIGKKLSRNRLDFLHDPALYDDLANTTTTSETRAILSDAISSGNIREVADLTKSWGHGIAAVIKPRMPRSRLMDKMPGIGIHVSDPKETANQIARHYRNVNAPEEALEEAFNTLAKARTKSGRRQAVIQVFGSGPNSLLASHGIDPEVADKMSRLYGDTFNEMWRGLVDELGVEVPTWEHILANGEKTYVGGPHALTELVEDWMPMPDARALRSLVDKFPNLVGKLEEGTAARVVAEFPGAAMEYFVQEVWKPLALARGAWLVRVLGEGQMRIAADGLDSLFSGHPLEALGFMMSKKRTIIPGTGIGITPRVTVSFLDDKWDEIYEYESSLKNVNSWAYRPGAQQTTTHTTLYPKGRHADAEFRHAMGRQLLKFNHDPVYSKWIQTDSLAEMTEWLTKGPGRKFLREMQEAFPGNLQTEQQVRKYLDEIELRWNTYTSGNTDLFDIIKSGHFTDSKGEVQSIYRAGPKSAKHGNPEINPAFTQHLDNYMDDFPNVIPGRQQAARRGRSNYQDLKRYMVQNFLYGAMSRSENLIAGSPVFKQSYTREMADMVQFMADEIRNADGVVTARPRAEMLEKARALNVPKRTIKHIEHLIATKKPGRLNLAEADIVAKGRAMDRTQKLLYSYAERRQVFDIARNFIPFGDAWYEVMSTWGRIVTNTAGKPLRRAQQVIEGSINSGFFHENRFGELAFTYPFSGAITEALTGTPVEMEGRVKGLSMFGEVIPGIGPVAQIPAAWFLKGKPELKDLEEILLPFGAAEGEEILNWKTWLPGWMKTAFSLAGLRTADDMRLWENTVSQIADYKASTGEYGYSEAEQTRLWQDAEADAKKIYGIRILAQFMAPAAPSLNFYAEDKSGRRFSAMALAEEFHKAAEKDYETAVHDFVEKYGEDALGVVVASSRTSVPGFPDSVEGQAWVDANPDLKGKYPLVYALFAPQGEWDPDVYSRQFAGPDRQALTAEQHISMLSDWINRYWRSEAMNRMGVNSYSDMNQAQRNAWEEISQAIDDEYPSAVVGIFERPRIEDMVKQLEAAAKDKKIKETPAGPALTKYLALRDEAQLAVERLKEEGIIDSQIKGFTKAKSLRPLREYLRSEAQALVDEYPAFEPLWDHVFSRELIKE